MQLIPRDAALPQIAEAVVAAARRGPIARPVDFEAWWELAAASVSSVLGSGADSFGGARQSRRVPSGQARDGPQVSDKESIELHTTGEAKCQTAQTSCLGRTAGRP